MAGKHGIALQKGIALAAATAKTVLQIVAAANHGVDIIEIHVGFDGTNNTHEAVEVELVRQTDAGTMTAGPTIVGANDSDGDTFDTTANHTATVEPAGTTVIKFWRVHPQTGYTHQMHDRAPVHIGAADYLGIRITAANVVNVDIYVDFEE